ncbi:MAG: hypothetical protein WCF52_05355, partial [Pseudolabrys sp.]
EGVLGIAAADFAHSILRHASVLFMVGAASALPSPNQASFAPDFQHEGPYFGGPALRSLPQHLKRSMLTA